MGTDRPTLTTEELCAQCEESTGFKPTVHQLGDWVNEGLLPPSQAGPGKGRRVGGTGPRRWDAECLPRLLLITQSRKGKYVSVARASHALATAGYSPGINHLRDVLKAYLFEVQSDIEHALRWNRTFLNNPKLSDAKKRVRFHESALRRYPGDLPNIRAVAEASQLVLVGVAATDPPDALQRLLTVFSYANVGASLHDATDGEVRQVYELVRQMLPVITPVLRQAYSVVVPAFAALGQDPRLAEAIQVFTDTFLNASTEELASHFRLPLTIIVIHGLRQGESVLQLFQAALEEVITSTFSHLGADTTAVLRAALLGNGNVAGHRTGTDTDSGGRIAGVAHE